MGNPELNLAARQEIEFTILGATPPSGHKYWGLTIFRCTYGNDAAWSRSIEHLESRIHQSLEGYTEDDLKQSLRLTVHSEPSILDEALLEVDSLDGQRTSISELEKTPRYEYCLHVDQEALESVIDLEKLEAKQHARAKGYVNLIDAGWEMPSADERAAELGIDNPEEDDPLDDGEIPIDGCKLHDVGWMKVLLSGLMPYGYAVLRRGLWEENYARPLAVGVF